eukprot:COSAG04_NODE_1482_length_6564_cov_3.075019_1_plen_295_part_00
MHRLSRHAAALRRSAPELRPAVAADEEAAEDARTPVCLVIGAGAGIGQGVATKFAAEGYHACVVRRGGGPSSLSDDSTPGKFEEFVQELRDAGGEATAFFANGTEPEEVGELIETIERDVGPIEVAIYNIGAQVGSRSLEKTSYRIFNLALSMGAVGAFALAKEVSPHMIKRGKGTIIYTSATAAYRGNAGQHAHTAAMGARKNLTQSISAELAPHGIHICHVNMDGPVDAPETIGKLMPEAFEKMLETKKPNDELLLPESIADTYWHLHTQPRNAWTLDLDLRPWKEQAWFNS